MSFTADFALEAALVRLLTVVDAEDPGVAVLAGTDGEVASDEPAVEVGAGSVDVEDMTELTVGVLTIDATAVGAAWTPIEAVAEVLWTPPTGRGVGAPAFTGDAAPASPTVPSPQAANANKPAKAAPD